jgi:hypothetical protein
MIPRRFTPKPRVKQEDNDCVIEIKRTKGGGKKIKIGKNCTRQQIDMLKESGEIKSEDFGS